MAITIAGSVGNILDVNVTVDISHPWDSDLNLFLLSPGGSITVELSSANGGSGDNYASTVFDDGAATAITSGSAPFTGSFQPEGSLADFIGTAADGVWTLSIVDTYTSGDHGVLNSWSLEIETDSDNDGLTDGFVDDADGDGDTDAVDLLAVIGQWGMTC